MIVQPFEPKKNWVIITNSSLYRKIQMYEIQKESFAYIVGSDLPHCHRIAYKLVACIRHPSL
jgi:hypothetical protein